MRTVFGMEFNPKCQVQIMLLLFDLALSLKNLPLYLKFTTLNYVQYFFLFRVLLYK